MSAAAQISRLPHRTDACLGSAARDWEGTVCDLYDAADVTTTLVADTLNGRDAVLDAREISRILFCVIDLSDRIGRFKATYYEALEGRTDVDL